MTALRRRGSPATVLRSYVPVVRVMALQGSDSFPCPGNDKRSLLFGSTPAAAQSPRLFSGAQQDGPQHDFPPPGFTASMVAEAT